MRLHCSWRFKGVAVAQVRELRLRIYGLEGFYCLIFKNKGLVGSIQILTLWTMTDIPAIVEPKIVAVIRRCVTSTDVYGIAIDLVQSAVGRRTAVGILRAVAALVHTEPVRIVIKALARQKKRHHMLLELNVNSGIGAVFLKIRPDLSTARSIIDTERVYSVLLRNRDVVYHPGIVHLGPTEHEPPHLEEMLRFLRIVRIFRFLRVFWSRFVRVILADILPPVHRRPRILRSAGHHQRSRRKRQNQHSLSNHHSLLSIKGILS